MKDFSFQFKPGDYLRDTQTLSEAAQVAYDRIMCEHIRDTSEDMSNICVSYESVKFISKKLTDEDRFLLFRTLTEVSGGYQIHWVAESVAERCGYIASRRKNRLKKKEDVNIISQTHDKHMSTHMDSDSDIDSDSFIDFDLEFLASLKYQNGFSDSEFTELITQFNLSRIEKSIMYKTKKQASAGLQKYILIWIKNRQQRGNGVTTYRSEDRNPANRKSRPNQILTDGQKALAKAILDNKVEIQ